MAVGLKKRRRIQLVAIGAVLLALATGVIGYAMRDGIEFFRSPSQIAQDPPRVDERFRLGGLVEEGSVERGQGARGAVHRHRRRRRRRRWRSRASCPTCSARARA